ncbi:MAG TPA: hypothetical protein VGF67_00525 [Ktedonobacteraceae bacterium]|jgi:hypothetical protein
MQSVLSQRVTNLLPDGIEVTSKQQQAREDGLQVFGDALDVALQSLWGVMLHLGQPLQKGFAFFLAVVTVHNPRRSRRFQDHHLEKLVQR